MVLKIRWNSSGPVPQDYPYTHTGWQATSGPNKLNHVLALKKLGLTPCISAFIHQIFVDYQSMAHTNLDYKDLK